jgi:hypothetical protein
LRLALWPASPSFVGVALAAGRVFDIDLAFEGRDAGFFDAVGFFFAMLWKVDSDGFLVVL